MDYAKVSQHNTQDSCWVILYNKVYDVTSFLSQHPGGARVILNLAGQDATEAYDPVHPPGTLESSLPKEAHLGDIDPDTLPKQSGAAPEQQPQPQQKQATGPPPLSTLLNIDEVERAAQPLLSKKAWAYYYSASDDLLSKSLNSSVYRSVLLRPRVFKDCTRCDTSTTLLSRSRSPLASALPLFVSPAAMARLAHPSGEQGIAAACARFGIPQIISNNASMTPEQIVADAPAGQVFGWQLYVQTERSKSEAMLRRIAKLPAIRFVVLTLDAPVPGKREDDERSKNEGTQWHAAVQAAATVEPQLGASADEDQGGLGKYLFAGTAADLTWATTLPWLAAHTHLPIVLKGIQTHEDAYSAALRAPQVQGIILSNHGGRAADTAPPALHTLLEIRKFCPEVFSRVDVLVDGGIRRGTDVVKALALGARAVGLGRAPLYGLSVGGPAGVARVLQILQDETATAMRLLGCETVAALGPQHVNARTVERDVYDGPGVLEKRGLWQQAVAKL